MEEQPKPSKPPEDEWGATTRIGYEERSVYQPRKSVPQRRGNRFLRIFGSILVVGGLAWITYISTAPDGLRNMLRPELQLRPIVLLGAGLLVLLLEKLVR